LRDKRLSITEKDMRPEPKSFNAHTARQRTEGLSSASSTESSAAIAVSLLTGGSDPPYVFGMTKMLLSKGVSLDLIGSDALDFPQFRTLPDVHFLNLRGSLDPNVKLAKKVLRMLRYYVKLTCYAATAKPRIFHILWNNRFETIDRTLLMLYYKLLRKKIVLTVHNVNMAKRDGEDTRLNRLTLRIQYHLADHLFVHTEKMKTELVEEFRVRNEQIDVIPFGMNNAVPKTGLTSSEAKEQLGLNREERVILFFGRITPYKGLESVISAFQELLKQQKRHRLIIAGRPDRCEAYWAALRDGILDDVQRGSILLKDSFIPDDEVEIYFKGADVLVLPYRDIYQSGVLSLGQSFGIPILAADVGSFREEIVEGKTGHLFTPGDSDDLKRAIEQYFAGDLYADLSNRRTQIRARAAERHSWDLVGQITTRVYLNLLQIPLAREAPVHDVSGDSCDMKAPS
jgi:D-inositol-3-phosphate glycosyltransferase